MDDSALNDLVHAYSLLIDNGHIAQAKVLIQQYPQYRASPELLTAACGDEQACELIAWHIDGGAPVDGSPPDHIPIVAAAEGGEFGNIRFLLGRGANVRGLPIITQCLRLGLKITADNFIDIASVLLEAGASVNGSDGIYEDAIQAASYTYGDSVRIIHWLIDHGATTTESAIACVTDVNAAANLRRALDTYQAK